MCIQTLALYDFRSPLLRLSCSISAHVTAALFLDDSGNHVSKFQIIPLKSSPFASGALAVKDQFSVPRAKILQSCNGLLLCRSSFLVHPSENMINRYSEDFSTNERGYFYFVYNPTTRHFKKLSLSSSLNEILKICSGNEIPGNYLLNVSLVFDPKTSPHYKIFLLSDKKDSETFMLQVFIYSSETDSWTSQKACIAADIFSDGFRIYYYSHGVFCNGAINFFELVTVSAVHYFDVNTMIFNKMDFPEDWFFRYFGESQGHLHCITHKHGYPKLEYDIVEIASDYSGWSLRYRVNLESIEKAYRCNYIKLLSIIRDKSAEEWLLVISADKSPIAYDLSNGTHRRLCDSELRLDDLNHVAFPYIESLICV